VERFPWILGLDLGSNSIGWAVIKCEVEFDDKRVHPRLHPQVLHSLNARIFQEMVSADKRIPKNVKRREKRGARNRLGYYKKRRRALAPAAVFLSE